MAVWYSLCPVGILFPVLVCLDPEKSGNPRSNCYARQCFRIKELRFDTGIKAGISHRELLGWTFCRSVSLTRLECQISLNGFGSGLPDAIFTYQKCTIKIMLVNFGKSRNCNVWYILSPFTILVTFGHVLWQFGTFSPVLVRCTKKNLATLLLDLKVVKHCLQRRSRLSQSDIFGQFRLE
jgi:hypothetical protein